MANEKHLAKLREGVEVWNTWRNGTPFIRPNLSRANLRTADLTGADLTGANLTGADFRWANFFGANFTAPYSMGGVSLGRVLLIEANLSETSFAGADLTGADLTRANLTGADLAGANFTGADLTEADLTGAHLLETVFGNTELRDTKGLETCLHSGPSTIDHRTLERSGTLPLAFLRGCGLPDNLIDYLPALLNEPIQFHSCFISYSSPDDDLARRLHTDLQDQGVRCWFAPADMKIGDKIRVRIDEVIRVHEKLLLVLSERSISSEWVEKEVETAFERERETRETVLFPVRLDDAVMACKTGWAADIKRSRHIGDFTRWKDHDAYRSSLERLLRDLEIRQERHDS